MATVTAQRGSRPELNNTLASLLRKARLRNQAEFFHECTIITESETAEELDFIKTPYSYKTLMRSHYSLQYQHL